MSALSLMILILIGVNWFYLTHQDRNQPADLSGSWGVYPRPSIQTSLPAARTR